MVQVTVQLPDEIARGLSEVPGEIPRRILESVAAEGFRSARLSRAQVAELLQLEPEAADRFIEEHRNAPRYDPTQIERQHQRNYECFRGQLPSLLQSYAGQFVAIAEGSLVDSDANEWTLVGRMARQRPGQPVLIQRVCQDFVPEIDIDTPDFEFVTERSG